MTYLTKIPNISVTTNQIGWGFRKMQIISYSFIFPKAYSGYFTILKVINAESLIVIFFGGTIGRTMTTMPFIPSQVDTTD